MVYYVTFDITELYVVVFVIGASLKQSRSKKERACRDNKEKDGGRLETKNARQRTV